MKRVDYYTTAQALMETVRVGSHEWSWSQELADMWGPKHREKTLALLDEVWTPEGRLRGIKSPVVVGADGRLWDGHHRVAVAQALKIPLPVEDRRIRR